MSTTAGRVFSGLTRVSCSRGILIHNSTVRLNSVRSLALSSQRPARSKKSTAEGEQVNNEPIKFSTSKASHRTWKVDRSMGSQFQRPWWKVLPISLFGTGFLLWCALRSETDIDAQLEKQLYEHLPGLLSEEEEKEVQNKSS
ncbi:protein CCSMST1 isoform X2 [Toxotes jaculatrix]|uniref:protein CCSMST1 isoform X2 n=1 Tax=Toxotes jaculatrix TaxID=941984 RepID=UPI001B3A8C46|nr:protein CCSMST1 isoform X2 [Toxotes jaculatrix]